VTAADILRAAAERIERGISKDAVEALAFAAEAPWDVDEAMRVLAAHLRYGADRNPTTVLARWSARTVRADMVREMRAAADNADRSM
jgi:hypothetical protein